MKSIEFRQKEYENALEWAEQLYQRNLEEATKQYLRRFTEINILKEDMKRAASKRFEEKKKMLEDHELKKIQMTRKHQ